MAYLDLDEGPVRSRCPGASAVARKADPGLLSKPRLTALARADGPAAARSQVRPPEYSWPEEEEGADPGPMAGGCISGCVRRSQNNSLIHRSDRGSQYLSIKYTGRQANADVDPSVGSVGDPCDNALAESVIGLFEAEVIEQLAPWKTMQNVEWETMHWVDR